MTAGSYKDSFFYILAVVLGMVSIVVPAIILGIDKYDHPVFPAARNGIEGYSWLSIAFQLAGGALLGALNSERAWRWGICMGAAFPLLSLFLVTTAKDSYNLVLPVALIVYAVLTIPCVIGALLGAYIRTRFI